MIYYLVKKNICIDTLNNATNLVFLSVLSALSVYNRRNTTLAAVSVQKLSIRTHHTSIRCVQLK